MLQELVKKYNLYWLEYGLRNGEWIYAIGTTMGNWRSGGYSIEIYPTEDLFLEKLEWDVGFECYHKDKTLVRCCKDCNWCHCDYCKGKYCNIKHFCCCK